jgi:hypothetical protein
MGTIQVGKSEVGVRIVPVLQQPSTMISYIE